MEDETTLEHLPANTEQSDTGMEGSMSEAAYAAEELKKIVEARKGKATQPPKKAQTATEHAAADEGAESEEEATQAEATDGDTTKDNEQSEDAPEAEESEVLSKLDPATQKAIAAMQKRIDKVTARAKTAEEALLKQKDDSGGERQAPASDDPNDKTSGIASAEELYKLETDARNTLEFIEASEIAILRAISKDSDTVTIGGQTYDLAELKRHEKLARRHIDRYIPQRKQFLKERSTASTEAKTILPAMFDEDTAEHSDWQAFQKRNPGIRNMPDAERMWALAKVGEKSLAKAGKIKASGVPPKVGSDSGSSAKASPKATSGGSERAKLTVKLDQANKKFEANPTQENHSQLLILQGQIKRLK